MADSPIAARTLAGPSCPEPVTPASTGPLGRVAFAAMSVACSAVGRDYAVWDHIDPIAATTWR